MRWPDAEFEMDGQLVEELVRQQHPDLLGPVQEISPGFDNTIWRLGDDLVVRLPRRLVAVQLIEIEQRWLPELASRLPLEIPAPVRVGAASAAFPWPWTIARWIDGTPGNLTSPAVLGNVARPLGHFLRVLHRDAPEGAPVNPFRGVPLHTHDLAVRARLEEVGARVDPSQILKVWETALDATTWSNTPQWIHGDPHPANLIVRGDKLVGVIDFGDLCAGDPATDLAGALMALPFDSLEEFFHSYGALDEATVRRTLGWAIHFGLMFLLLGESDDRSYEPLGRQAISNAIQYSRTHR